MKIAHKYHTSVVNTKVHEQVTILKDRVNGKIRKNVAPDRIPTCAWCMKKIDQSGETIKGALIGDIRGTYFILNYHEHCWHEAIKEAEGNQDEKKS